jgi:hypothetical protein
MANVIGTDLWFKFVCFSFISTYVGSSVIETHTTNGSDDITH